MNYVSDLSLVTQELDWKPEIGLMRVEKFILTPGTRRTQKRVNRMDRIYRMGNRPSSYFYKTRDG